LRVYHAGCVASVVLSGVHGGRAPVLSPLFDAWTDELLWQRVRRSDVVCSDLNDRLNDRPVDARTGRRDDCVRVLIHRLQRRVNDHNSEERMHGW
jgi:hypothetical protein